MHAPFTITYQWEQRPAPYPYSPDDYVDASPVLLGLTHFLARYHGVFSLTIQDVIVRFDLGPDLSTVFEALR